MAKEVKFRVQGSNIDETIPLASTDPIKVLDLIDLARDDLASVRGYAEAGDSTSALEELLSYFRHRHALTAGHPPEGRSSIELPTDPSRRAGLIEEADAVVERRFAYLHYPSAAYEGDMDWEWDPAGDIEWVASMYRFPWVRPLAAAFALTGDERYVVAFVDLVSDWIAKHPLERRTRAHPNYPDWRGFAWLDIQTGIRATNLCDAFPLVVHATAFTAGFLARFLASLHDHQVKTRLIPLKRPHNKTIFELKGFARIAGDFPEFRESAEWKSHATERLGKLLREQVTSDGVQREWSFGYHVAVAADAIAICDSLGRPDTPAMTDVYDDITRMADYVFDMTTPELGAPMFGDAERGVVESTSRFDWAQAGFLEKATGFTGDPKYRALVHLDEPALPPPRSAVYREAGILVFRNGWGTDQIYAPFHCSPPGISAHDQQDNGTFELYAHGRWLMPDTGFFTYGHDEERRAWHRRTWVHQTLTVDRADTEIDGRIVGFMTGEDGDAVCMENRSYRDLLHRRTVWFVGHRALVIFDEAIGACPGVVELHFQFAAGALEVDTDALTAKTTFPDSNVFLLHETRTGVSIRQGMGWHAWKYGYREERPIVALVAPSPAPAEFLTAIVPFPGAEAPEVRMARVSATGVAFGIEIDLEIDGRRYRLHRSSAPTGREFELAVRG